MSAVVVLDSSAILAVMLSEPGGKLVLARLATAHVSAVTLTETIEVLTRKGDRFEAALMRMRRVAGRICPFDDAQAEAAALLLTRHRSDGLSLGDAACLALALHLQADVLTADRIWATFDLAVAVTLIR